MVLLAYEILPGVSKTSEKNCLGLKSNIIIYIATNDFFPENSILLLASNASNVYFELDYLFD